VEEEEEAGEENVEREEEESELDSILGNIAAANAGVYTNNLARLKMFEGEAINLNGYIANYAAAVARMQQLSKRAAGGNDPIAAAELTRMVADLAEQKQQINAEVALYRKDHNTLVKEAGFFKRFMMKHKMKAMQNKVNEAQCNQLIVENMLQQAGMGTLPTSQIETEQDAGLMQLGNAEEMSAEEQAAREEQFDAELMARLEQAREDVRQLMIDLDAEWNY